MALKRLDEEFELKPGTQLLPYMKRLLPSLEGRFQNLESTQDLLAGVNEDIRAAALLRMNEILIPATEDIIEVTKMGFLLAPVAGMMTIAVGYMTFQIEPGVQQDTFTPSPYLIIEHTPDDYAIARLESYDQILGVLEVTITAVHGNTGPWDDWMVSSTPGMADSTKLYHDAIAPLHAEVVTDYNEVVTMHAEILSVAQDLEEAGIDLFNYVRKDGTTPFAALQTGIHPPTGSNDATLATTAWARARMIEYWTTAVTREGDTMTGYLTLAFAPANPMHAATKAYVDTRLSAGGGQNISGGFTFTAYSQAPGNFTLTPEYGNYQYTTNGGAFIVTAPIADCAVDLLVTNIAGAGVITFSGFTVGSNTGDLLTTTNGHRFIISMRRINGVSTYVIKALQ